MMTVSIEFFGRQRIITGTNAINIPINSEADVGKVLQYVRERYPDLPLDEKTILMVVNQEMVSAQTVVMPNDVIAFLPAIGGG